MYGNSIAGYEGYLRSGKQTGFLRGLFALLLLLLPLLFVAEFAVGAVGVNSLLYIVVELYNRPTLVLVFFSELIDLLLHVFGIRAFENIVPVGFEAWFVACLAREFLFVVWLEANNRALSSVYETS